MKTRKEILEAASLRFGVRFTTLREVEIHILKRQQVAEEVSPEEMFKLSFDLPMQFTDASTCVGEGAKEVQAECMRHGIKTMLHLMPRNQLYVPPKEKPVCKSYKRGTPEGDEYLKAVGLY